MSSGEEQESDSARNPQSQPVSASTAAETPDAKVPKAPTPHLVAASVFVSGLGIGVLMGLAISPVVGTVVGASVTLIASLLSLSQDARLSWTSNGQLHEVWFSLSNTVALSSCLFIVGLVGGALLGIHLRTHQTLGAVMQVSTQAKAGSAEPAQGGPTGQPQNGPAEKPPYTLGVLFSDPTYGGCLASLPKLSDAELRHQIENSESRLSTIFLDRRNPIRRGDLVTLFGAFVCSRVPLSTEDISRIRTNPAYGQAHPHPVVAKLSQLLQDQDLLGAVVERLGAK